MACSVRIGAYSGHIRPSQLRLTQSEVDVNWQQGRPGTLFGHPQVTFGLLDFAILPAQLEVDVLDWHLGQLYLHLDLLMSHLASAFFQFLLSVRSGSEMFEWYCRPAEFGFGLPNSPFALSNIVFCLAHWDINMSVGSWSP